MSIFSCLAKAESNVQKALKKEWDAIPQAAKDEILIILKAVNVIKQNNQLDGQEVAQLVGKVVGSDFVIKMIAVADKVAVSLGITVPAGTGNVEVFGLIAKNLAPRTGENWMDAVLRTATYFVVNLLGGGTIVRTIAIPLVQWVYDNVLSKQPVIAASGDPVSPPTGPKP